MHNDRKRTEGNFAGDNFVYTGCKRLTFWALKRGEIIKVCTRCLSVDIETSGIPTPKKDYTCSLCPNSHLLSTTVKTTSALKRTVPQSMSKVSIHFTSRPCNVWTLCMWLELALFKRWLLNLLKLVLCHLLPVARGDLEMGKSHWFGSLC